MDGEVLQLPDLSPKTLVNKEPDELSQKLYRSIVFSDSIRRHITHE